MKWYKFVKALMRKDLFFEPVSRRLAFLYCAMSTLFLLASSLNPSSRWISIPGYSAVTVTFGSMNTLLLPMLPLIWYLQLIQKERVTGAWTNFLVFPITTNQLFWGRVISCWSYCVILCAYNYLLLIALKFIFTLDADITGRYFSSSFIFYLASLLWMASIIAVGIGLNIDPQVLPILAGFIITVIVLAPFVLSPRIAGWDVQDILLRLLLQTRSLSMTGVIILIAATLSGLGFSSWFGHKRSYL